MPAEAFVFVGYDHFWEHDYRGYFVPRAAAFEKLQNEITLEAVQLKLPTPWNGEECKLWSGLVPIGNDIFRKIVVRGTRMAQIDPHDFSVLKWTDKWYYEVCSHPDVYAKLEGKKAAAK